MSDNGIMQRVLTEVLEMKKEMKDGFTELRTDVAELKADVAVLKTDVAVLKTDVAQLKTDVAGLKGEVKRLDEKIDANYELLEQFYVEQSEWNTAMTLRVDNIEARQLVYETQVQRNTFKIDQLEKKIKT